MQEKNDEKEHCIAVKVGLIRDFKGGIIDI